MPDDFLPFDKNVMHRFCDFNDSLIRLVELQTAADGKFTVELHFSAMDLHSEKDLPQGYFDYREVSLRVSDVSEFRFHKERKLDDQVICFGIVVLLQAEFAAIEFSGYPDFDPESLNDLCHSRQYIIGTRLEYRILPPA